MESENNEGTNSKLLVKARAPDVAWKVLAFSPDV